MVRIQFISNLWLSVHLTSFLLFLKNGWMKACLRTFDVTGKKFRVPLRFVTNDLLEGRKNVIVRFNQLWSLVHQDCKNHKNIIGIWTTKRKAELDIGEKESTHGSKGSNKKRKRKSKKLQWGNWSQFTQGCCCLGKLVWRNYYLLLIENRDKNISVNKRKNEDF